MTSFIIFAFGDPYEDLKEAEEEYGSFKSGDHLKKIMDRSSREIT